MDECEKNEMRRVVNVVGLETFTGLERRRPDARIIESYAEYVRHEFSPTDAAGKHIRYHLCPVSWQDLTLKICRRPSNMATMNALVYYPPGGPTQMKSESVPIPESLDKGEMLVKVRAAAVMYQEPYWPIYQAKGGSYPPQILCSDFSGTVTEVGQGFDNSDIQLGSEIMAFTTIRHDLGPKQGMKKYHGAAAEFAVATLDTAVLKPKNLGLLDAASVPLPALTAWQALYDHGNLQAGQKVLITGMAERYWFMGRANGSDLWSPCDWHGFISTEFRPT